ncbi:HeH/LEM domain-containing protein, partial [Pasteurella multocida]|nr:HeH/LEM domain-containing protein [Pasteurella multocida]MDY0682615.1 HeH/LEM domain-containing protein [Pasteurella multocida]
MFFRIEKQNEQLVVHQSTLSEHESLGWVVLGPEETKKDDKGLSALKVDELKAMLTEKGIDFDPKAKKEDLIALLSEEGE